MENGQERVEVEEDGQLKSVSINGEWRRLLPPGLGLAGEEESVAADCIISGMPWLQGPSVCVVLGIEPES